ncbi:MAG TPA: sigma-70 family RNA polymerase sigma factor [Gemmataceae bacterium]|nr:sigma-70 family RNA polymerase sigma factor [Gemmataceae bacterium]
MGQRAAAERPVIDLTDLHDDAQRLHERVLVLRAQAVDRAAFDELVTLYQERLTYYVHRLVQDSHQSRDILQQVWLDVFRTLGKLQSPGAFRVWLYRIAHDRVVTYLRRQIVDSDARETLAVNAIETDHWNDLDLLENVELVHFALNKLSVIHREIMTLRFLEEMDIEEIARVMECSEGTAKSRLHYAKNAMRRIIAEERGHA